jgi:hypothetical protein
MPIAPKCVQRLNAAAGKTLTENQLAEIERRMRRTSTMLARDDINAWRAMSPDKRILAAAERAQADIKAEAQLKVERAKLQLAKTAATEERIGRQQRLHGKDGRTQSLIRDMEETERYVEAVKREVTADMLDAIKAAGDKQGAGMGRKVLMAIFDADNPAMTKDLAIEIYGNADGSTGNAIARAGAKAWLDAMETMRQRFNSAGGEVGKLDYGYLPQPHDQVRVLRAGPDKWSAQVLPLLDRGRHLNEDGSRMSDAQVLDFLKGAHDTIATGGANKREPGAFAGTGARANRGAESREIHFASGDAYLQYLAKYGGGSMFDAMVGHVAQRARDIALVERYGPNPANQMRLQMDLAARADKTNVGEGRKFLATVDTYWNIVSGNASMVAGRGTLAQFGGGVRNIQVAGKLAGAVLSSLPDIGTYMVTVGYNRLPWFDALKNIAKANSADARAELDAHGLMAESLMASLNRWTGENVRDGVTGRLANATMKLSLMNFWTDSLRRAFQATMMQGTARLHGKAWAALDDYDRFRLESAGITEADWQIINAAKLDDMDGRPMLTPEAVRGADDAAIDAAIGGRLQAIRDDVAAQVSKLENRNAQEVDWIAGRQDRIREAQDSANRAVRDLLARKQAKNDKAAEPILQRMSLLEAQREQAELLLRIEADLNKLVTQDDVRGFLNAVEDGASADKTSVGPANKAVREGLSAAESAGRRYGEAKGRLERRMKELENKIAEMDRDALGAADDAAKAAGKRIDELRSEFSEFQQRAAERMARRAAVVQRLQNELPDKLAAARESAKREAATKLLALYVDESYNAVVNPDLATRALSTGGEQRGTVRGELWRTAMQFKSFPIAMISRHWRRAIEAPGASNRLAYASALGLSLTLLGAMSFQAKEMARGKDPVDMTQPKFWVKAMSQGGAAGFYGDLMLENTKDSLSRADPLFRLLGPTAGSTADLYELTKGNFDEWSAGKDTKAGAEALRFAQSHAPFINLWYLRTALERALINDLHENLSPGYLARMKQRARKDYGNEFFWEPGDLTPDRAPDFANAVGQ